MSVLKISLDNKLRKENSNNADCLVNEFKNQETLDLLVKLNVLEKSELKENEMKNQMNETKNELKRDFGKIAVQCQIDESKFVSTFNCYLGIKNVTLEASEHNYCFAKFAADNNLLPLENIELNPNAIEIASINCDEIIEKERRMKEDELLNTLYRHPKTTQCVLNAYRRENLFGSEIAAKVLNNLEFPKATKDAEDDKIAEKILDNI